MEAIRHFAYCGRCGAPAAGQAENAGGPFRCAACGFTLFFNAAGAVGAIIRRPDGRALFVRRAKDPARGKLGLPGGFVDPGENAEQALVREAPDQAGGKLGLPGGFVDPGENAEQALVREVREEVGLELRNLQYLTSHANRYAFAGVTYHTVDLFYTGDADDASGAVPLDAVEAVEWHDPATVPPDEIAFDSMRAALAALRKKA